MVLTTEHEERAICSRKSMVASWGGRIVFYHLTPWYRKGIELIEVVGEAWRACVSKSGLCQHSLLPLSVSIFILFFPSPFLPTFWKISFYSCVLSRVFFFIPFFSPSPFLPTFWKFSSYLQQASARCRRARNRKKSKETVGPDLADYCSGAPCSSNCNENKFRTFVG